VFLFCLELIGITGRAVPFVYFQFPEAMKGHLQRMNTEEQR
jgi:hypothetical protein